MATYKVVDAEQLNADMSSVADSIRTKGGTTDALAWPDGYKTAIEAIQTGGGEPSLQSKSVTYTANGTNTVTPDGGYDGLSSVDVTVDVSGGGGGGAGFSVTFPATAVNWVNVNAGGIVQVDGTVVNMIDYSTLAGKTIPNVIEICVYGSGYYFPRMTVQTGKIMLTYLGPMSVLTRTAVDGESSMVYIGDGSTSRWIPLADTVISAIEMYNTD